MHLCIVFRVNRFLLSIYYVYFNARSLLSKFDNLSLVHVHNPHIEICVPHFQSFRFDRNRHGGGVLIYVSEEFSVSPLPSSPPHLLNSFPFLSP